MKEVAGDFMCSCNASHVWPLPKVLKIKVGAIYYKELSDLFFDYLYGLPKMVWDGIGTPAELFAVSCQRCPTT